jgi:hypothetical protein
VLKLIACICMLIDHINTCLYDRASVWAWLIGRLAFPLFGLTFVLTLKVHKGMATAKRLFIWAICTQPVYALAFANTGFSPWWAGNILFSFAAVAYLVGLGKSPTIPRIVEAAPVVMLACITQAPSSFGLAGIVFMLALWFLMQGTLPWVATTFASLAFLGLNPGAPALAGCLAVSLAGIVAASSALRCLRPHRWLHPRITLLFYVGHLGAIGNVVP